jgi:hypothetical protein
MAQYRPKLWGNVGCHIAHGKPMAGNNSKTARPSRGRANAVSGTPGILFTIKTSKSANAWFFFELRASSFELRISSFVIDPETAYSRARLVGAARPSRGRANTVSGTPGILFTIKISKSANEWFFFELRASNFELDY